MKNLTLCHVVGGAIALAGFSASASAAPVLYCKDGPGIDLVALGCISGESDSYPGGGDGIYSNAGGGDPEAKVEQAILGATGVAVDISLYGKSDGQPSWFTFSGPLTSLQSGTWDVVDDSILVKYITIKAANSFALYELAGAGANSGSFTTLGILNNGGQQPEVSHISFWVVPSAVPEPASWALLIGGFALAGGMLRRRRPSRMPLAA